MKQKKIRKLFNKVYKYPNPVFCRPIQYFQHKNFLCEIAVTKTMRDMVWDPREFRNSNPLYIFEAMFVDDGCWVTVLQREGKDIIERHDLNGHLDSPREINSFINRMLWKNSTK